MKSEPVVSLVVGLIVAACGLLVAFGVPVTPEQVAALSAFAVAALGLAVWVRGKVTPTGKANEAGLTLVEVLVVLLIVLVVAILLGVVR